MTDFKIDGKSCADFGIYLLDRSIRSLPNLRENEITIPGKHGIYDAGTEFGTNTITLDLGVVERNVSTVYSKIREFANYISPLVGYRELIFEDEPSLVRYVKVSEGAEIDMMYNAIKNIGKFSITFKMADPFVYKADWYIEEWDALHGGSTIIVNNGGIECPVILKIYVPANTIATQPATGLGTTNSGTTGGASVTGVAISINGQTVKYKGEIEEGDEVIIDTGNFTVTMNGQNAMQYWEGEFPQLQAGENIITEHDDSGVGAKVVFQFRERWL
ncbi:phage tail domain-containing protein [Mahella australiensis]|uniref:Phage tail component n=1 Tax=Mahella australiensis (strain DSM 15567 / CIP 107919 / 50-1 BON) TaxID=697281 RepID=F3ZVD3_MAHA5|nr:phage tail family protein [Mahella australiensis]AEE95283.1 hypothetical protein Mahau_0060 [Mahella australiensis 50-1 BON]